MDVQCRYKFDPLGQPSGASNFIASHNRFVDPEYVLKDHVSLFYVNKDEAVWVEVDEGVDPTRCQYSAFFYFAQWKLAKKLIIMPIHIFNKLGTKVEKPKIKLIFLSNTARCGSTLITRVFSETEHCLAYSEPDCLNALTQLRNIISDSERDRMFTNCINCLCKPISSRKIEACIIKLTQPTMVELPHIKKLFPDSYHLFLYRDALAVTKSLIRSGEMVPIFAMMEIFGRWSSKVTKNMMKQMGLHADHFEVKLETAFHFGTIMWSAAMRQYLDFQEKGLQIAAARYEDIIQNPKAAFQKIFQYCDLPFDFAAVEKGMSTDSQRSTPLSAENTKHKKAADLTDEVKFLTDKISDQFQVPRLNEAFIVPGTITSSM